MASGPMDNELPIQDVLNVTSAITQKLHAIRADLGTGKGAFSFLSLDELLKNISLNYPRTSPLVSLLNNMASPIHYQNIKAGLDYLVEDEGSINVTNFPRYLLPKVQQPISGTHNVTLPYTPLLTWLEKLLYAQVSYNALEWRKFEEAIAELLEKDGHSVTLGPGCQDGGIDIIASKEDPILGTILSVWQAKMLKSGNHLRDATVRELVGAFHLNGIVATKGIIVTSTYLTRPALKLVNQHSHFLGKRDRDDLLRWIEQIKKRQ